MNRILITGAHSGCGKTTVTCALLTALKNRGLHLAAFKCGPDYIDPMFHRRAIGVPAYNLDPFFCTGEQMKSRITAHGGGVSLLEGVMGYYDGIGPEGRYSTCEVARETQTPAVLVIDVKGMYASAGAVLKGFLDYHGPSGIQGVLFNNASPALYEGLCTIAKRSGVTPLGFLPWEKAAAVKSRHLGLITADEIADLEQNLALLASLAEKYIDIDGLLALAASAPALDAAVPEIRPLGAVRLAVARDEAFCFLYEENLERLRALGCEIVFFSPLRDTALPVDAAGLYLCGGYPELHLEKLSGNAAMLEAVSAAIRDGMPTIAECGGFLYLHETLEGVPLAGIVRAAAYRTETLQRFGYVTLRAGADNLLCGAGEGIRAHEFHYYESTDGGADFVAEKPLSARNWPCVHATETLYAGFPHLYFDANPVFAENFVRKAIAYAERGPGC
ncbi:MAG: cobyrinate a,c-diamide synthase [Clostridia bacterium]|jgi:cobyrinic acid a,c-diamide synthase|nr:cobyrinate a,c-diamide synthase [Clostridia bacterium]